jgi:type II secretion system protein G
MNDPRPIQKRNAFTLIELLVVIAIIAILASLVLATSGYVQDKAARSRAEAEIAALSAALESYKVDNGDYPTNSTPANNKVLIDVLMPTNASQKVYFEFSKRMLDNPDYMKATKVLDPYGKPYNYQYNQPPGTNRSGANFFDLWSIGKPVKSNETNEAAWIKNW